MDSELMHVGVAHDRNPPGRGSGRYPFGSGNNPVQHQFDFLSEYQKMRDAGLSQSEIARDLLGKKGVDKKTGKPIYANSTDLRAAIAIANSETKRYLISEANRLYEECNGNVSEVGRRMGKTESTVRGYLKESRAERNSRYENTAQMLAKRVDEVGILDVSSGTENLMGITDYTKKVAVAMCKQRGYVQTWVSIDQQFGVGNKTNITVLARKPENGETEQDVKRWVQEHKLDVKAIQDFSPDQGKTFWSPEFPTMVDSKRIKVRYAEEGGKDKDGVIELRRGVEDISLGGSQYAQVRVGVNGTHYLKGMAMYGDDSEMPPGIDIIFNTNKHEGTPMCGPSDNTVLKLLKRNKETGEVDEKNPFGALIKSPKDLDGVIVAGGQRHYIDENGESKLSPINKLRDEGDWDTWSKNLSAQFLSKQPLKLINQQIDASEKQKREELDEIMALTNPAIRKKMLEDYADQTDTASVRLKTVGFKNQAAQVILPIPTVKEGEIYAPNYEHGDVVALIRYPHAGPFEIPVLTVNNHDPKSEAVGKGWRDAVGINPQTAAQLSGADHDGDTAIVIPLKSNKISVTHTDYLDGLKRFDPGIYQLPGESSMKDDTKQKLMGEATNLITDMTASNASYDKIERAVKYSMVVIDAQKHNYDYKRAEKELRIQDLKDEFQGGGGASTIFSKAKSVEYVPERKELTRKKDMTPEQLEAYNRGEKVYIPTGRTKMVQIKDPKKMTPDELVRYNAGKKVYRDSGEIATVRSTKMAEAKDAFDLVRNMNNPKEVAYANYANTLKDLAQRARAEARAIEPTKVNPVSTKTYAVEVASLKQKLSRAKMNSPRERQAEALAGIDMAEVKKSNPDMDWEHLQREKSRALTRARAVVGAKKEPIYIEDREWEAIQSNAVSWNLLNEILINSNQDRFKQLATPRSNNVLSTSDLTRIRNWRAQGVSNSEIASRLGVSLSTVVQANV